MIKPNRYEDQPFGLPESTRDDIRRFLMGWPEIEKVQVFGSRAMGHYRHNSDIDICILGKDIDYDLFNRIQKGFNNLPTPYKFDVALYGDITHQPFKDHIDAHGVDFKMDDE